MRNFEQRITEIQRRSEIIQKKRKRLKRLLAWSVFPMLFICIYVLALRRGADFNSAQSKPNDNVYIHTNETTMWDTTDFSVSVEVVYGKRREFFTSKNQVDAILSIIEEIRLFNESTPILFNEENSEVSVDTYSFIIWNADGTQTVFCIAETRLMDLTSSVSYLLDEYDLKMIHEVLRIPVG